MKHRSVYRSWFGVVVGLILFNVTLISPLFASDGKTTFVANKCNQCHAIESLSIKKIEKPDENSAAKGPDLSKVGGEHEAPWFRQWLKREVEKKNEKGEMKKHKKIYKGTDADLAILVELLASLK